MKLMSLRSVVLAVGVMTAVVACRDEKRIAELEAQFNQQDVTKKTAQTPIVTPETQPADQKPEGPLPVIQFAENEYDFGKIKEGDVVEHTFQVTNTGDAPLIIQNASASCGCTVPDWTKTPIEKGGKGFVKATFNSSGKSGVQNKTITLTANTWPKQAVLRFKANIIPKADASNGPVK
jgi:hypothetical protein